jgi:hypothetical protein
MKAIRFLCNMVVAGLGLLAFSFLVLAVLALIKYLW